MFSSTTMELSTIMPTPMAMPPRLIMFSVRSKRFISTNTARMHTGMDTAMVSVAPTTAARATPRMIFWKAEETARLIKSEAK